MKNMNERKAEVYRRGRERIRAERRLRRSLAAVCLPVAAIVICLPLLRQKPENHWMPTQTQHMGTDINEGMDSDLEAGEQPVPEDASGVDPFRDSAAMIQSAGTGETFDSVLWVTEPEAVKQLRRQINALLQEAEPPVSSESSDLAEIRYRLTFRNEDGTLESYLLAENYLKEESTGSYFRLDAEEAAALKQLLQSMMD